MPLLFRVFLAILLPPLQAQLSSAPLCRLGLHKLGDLLLNRLVVQALQLDLLLLSIVYTLVSAVHCGACRFRRTVSREEGGLEAAGLADEDWGVWVVLLHCGVAALEEVPVCPISH